MLPLRYRVRSLTLLGMLCIAPWAEARAAVTEVVAEGKIVERVPSKKEIYVLTETGKNEYYFNEETTVSEAGVEKQYSDLSEGNRVRVTAKKIGKRLDPIRVEILER